MVLRCIKIFHSKRGNSHWCQNSNQRKFLEHSSLIITVSLPTLFLLTLSSLLSLSLSDSFTPSLFLSASFLLVPNFQPISHFLSLLIPSIYPHSLSTYIQSLLPLSISSPNSFLPTISPHSLIPLSLFTPLSLYSHPSLSPHSNTYLSPHPYFLTIIPLSYPCLSHQSLRPPLSFFSHPSLTPLYLLPLLRH